MLKTMRKNLKTLSITLWLVIASFILFIFIDWGAGRYLGVSREDVVAKVGDDYIDVKTYEESLRNRLMAISRRSPNMRLTRGAIERLGIPESVLSDLIRDRIIKQRAHELNIVVTDQEVADYIIHMPVFQKDGKFVGKEEYQRILAANGIPVDAFEEEVRSIIYQEKLFNVVTAGVMVSGDEVKRAYRYEREAVELEYVYVPFADIEVDQPTEQEIKAHFEANKTKYIIPEKRRGKYVILKVSDFEDKVRVSLDKVKKYYRDNIDLYTEPEKFHIFKIYVKKENKKKIDKALEELKAGRPFEEVARAYSDGIKAQQGGDWGEITLSMLQPVEQEWVRRARTGAISPVLELPGGYEIIKLAKRIPAKERPLEEVRASIEKILKRKEAQKLVSEKAAELAEKAKKKKSLEKAAKEMGFQVKDTGLLEAGDTLEGDPFGNISKALFSLKKGEVSDPINLLLAQAVVQLEEIAPARPAKYEEVAEKIKEELIQARKKEKARKIIEEFLKGGQLPPVAEHNTVTFYYRKPLGNIKPSRFLDRLVLDAKDGEWIKPVEIQDGLLCFKVLRRSGFDEKEFEKKKEEIKNRLLEQRKQLFYQAYVSKLMKEAKVEINTRVYQKVKDMILGRF